MVADSVEFLRGNGLAGALRRRALLRRLPRAIPSSACACSKRRRRTARAVSCCATPTAGRCRDEVERIVAEVVEYFGADVKVAVHLHDDAGTGVANALAGVRGGATQVQGTINGYGERTGNCNLTTIIPNLTLKMGIETIPRDRLERLTPVAHHVAELVNMALNPQAALRGRVRVRAQGRAAHQRDREAARRVRARVARRRRQRHALRRLGARRQVDDRAEGEGARARARRSAGERRGRHVEAARARGLPLRGRRRLARAADAPGDGLGAAVVPGRVVPGDHRRPRRSRHAHRQDRRDRDDRGDDQGARRRRANGRDRRGQRPGERARHRAAHRARRQLPGARAGAPHRLQGARARHRTRAPAP